MKISRSNFLKKGLSETLLLGTATSPQSLQVPATESLTAAPKKAKRIVMPPVTLPNRTNHPTGSVPEPHGGTDNAWTEEMPSTIFK